MSGLMSMDGLYCVVFCGALSVCMSSASGEVTISVPESAMVGYEGNVIGFNTPMGRPGFTGRYDSDEVYVGAKKLPIGAMRFPGGTVANFFNWQSQSLDSGKVEAVGKKRMVEALKKDRARGNERASRLDLESFFVATETIGAIPYLVLNVLTSDTKSVIESIEGVKKLYKGPVRWEIGNELALPAYAEKYSVPGGWSAELYAFKANKIVRYIHDLYPKDAVGINVSEVVLGRAPVSAEKAERIEKVRMKWDQVVSGIEGYDAVIVHPYVHVTDRHVNWLKLQRGRGDDDLDDISRGAVWRWLFSSAAALPKSYSKRLSNRFPGKQIWITETGIAGSKAESGSAGDLSRLLFNIAYFSEWMRAYPRMNAYLYHGLFYGRSDNAVLYNDYSYTGNGLALALISEVLKGAKVVAVPQFAGSPVFEGVGPFSDQKIAAITGLYARSGAEHRILLANSSGENVSVHLEDKCYEAVRYGGKVNRAPAPGEVHSLSELKRDYVRDGVYVLKPYSATLLTSRICALSGDKAAAATIVGVSR